MMNEAESKRRLEAALHREGETHSLADLVELLKRGEAQWWSNGDGMIVSEVLAYPQAKLLNYWLVAGELQACFDLQEAVDEFGLAHGCTRAVATGRRGWERTASAYGWQLRSYRYSKTLGH